MLTVCRSELLGSGEGRAGQRAARTSMASTGGGGSPTRKQHVKQGMTSQLAASPVAAT